VNTAGISEADDAHLLVVDDDARLRALLQRYLGSNGFRVSVASDAAEARALMKSMAFDLLIVDRMMPGETGIDFTRSVRANSQIPVLMLTAMGDAQHRIEGLEHGADDYLPKPFEPRELLLRCGALLRRTTPPSRSPHREVKMGEAVFDPERGELRRKGKPVRLTSSESALLKLFATNAGRPFSRTDLCTRLGVTLERSIDVQVTRLRRKIEEDPKLPLYIQTVRGVGYVLVPDRVT
jgi:two-component system phosphate regulon response regulator OmpR